MPFAQATALHIPLANNSVHMVVTSPPYWGLRSYNTNLQKWTGGWVGELGNEPTSDLYIAHLVEIFNEVKRVLRPDGTFWLNMGDSYGSGNRKTFANDPKYPQRKNASGEIRIKQGSEKQLLGIPWRVALALQSNGWILRRDIIWAKTNPMPESAKDRPSNSHEYVFLFSKGLKYYYDNIAVAESAKYGYSKTQKGQFAGSIGGVHGKRTVIAGEGGLRNLRSVWFFSIQSYTGAHYATFPEELARLPILAGTSVQGCCPKCRAPYKRKVVRTIEGTVKTIGWQPTCKHRKSANPLPCIVLDPFAGSGTSIQVARNLGRVGIGLDLSIDYLLEQAVTRGDKRVSKKQIDKAIEELPLFAMAEEMSKRKRRK